MQYLEVAEALLPILEDANSNATENLRQALAIYGIGLVDQQVSDGLTAGSVLVFYKQTGSISSLESYVFGPNLADTNSLEYARLPEAMLDPADWSSCFDSTATDSTQSLQNSCLGAASTQAITQGRGNVMHRSTTASEGSSDFAQTLYPTSCYSAGEALDMTLNALECEAWSVGASAAAATQSLRTSNLGTPSIPDHIDNSEFWYQNPELTPSDAHAAVELTTLGTNIATSAQASTCEPLSGASSWQSEPEVALSESGATTRWKTCEEASKPGFTTRKRRHGGVDIQVPCSIGQVSLDASPDLAELRQKFNMSDSVLLGIMDVARNFIRPELTAYLEEALPRWKDPGLWAQEQLPEPFVSGSGSEKLLRAYQYICGLEDRIGDDQIRSRIAVVLLHTGYEQGCHEWQQYRSVSSKQRGRGDASAVIDNILANVHSEWQNPAKRKILRSRFHDKKRYGKRWLLLAEPLGAGVLLVCSSKVAAMIQNTGFTSYMIEALVFCVERSCLLDLRILKLLDDAAKHIMQTGTCRDIDISSILKKVRAHYSPSTG